jgi:hypothetical protein
MRHVLQARALQSTGLKIRSQHKTPVARRCSVYLGAGGVGFTLRPYVVICSYFIGDRWLLRAIVGACSWSERELLAQSTSKAEFVRFVATDRRSRRVDVQGRRVDIQGRGP